MTRIVEDASLTPPRPPARVPEVGRHPPELALAGPCGEGPFLVEGARVALRGRERGGADLVRSDGTLVAAHLQARRSSYVNAVLSPGQLRRELVVDGATREETLLAAPTLPLVVARWSAGPAGGAPDRKLHVSVRLLPESRTVRYRVARDGDGDGVVSVGAEAPDNAVALCVSPSPEILAVEAHAEGGIEVRLTTSAVDSPTCLLAFGSPDTLQRTLDAAAHLDAHERGASAAPTDGLTLRTGVTEIDVGTAWARRRVSAAAGRAAPKSDREGLLWTGLGALAAGDGEAARGALERLERTSDGPEALLLAARLALSLGDQAPARRHVGALHLSPTASPEDAAGEERVLWALALDEVADALRHGAPPETLDQLRERARALPRSTTRGVRLPMAGDAAGEGEAGHVLRDLLRPEEPSASGEAEEAYTRWRRAVTEGLTNGPAGRGSWDPADASTAPRAGAILAEFVHRILGWLPDAPVGRATLAPRLPAHLLRFHATGLPVGDARVTFKLTRTGEGRVSYELQPTEGRTPPTLVFAPWLPVATVTATALDGRDVELDTRPVAGGTLVRLQIPLDGTRTLEVAGS